MSVLKETLSVHETAVLCGVGHSTVGYWIRSKKLFADRVGKNYSIPVKELLFFLQSTGRKIPVELADRNLRGRCFRTIGHCWKYHKGTSHGRNCRDCIVFNNQLEVCFSARASSSLCCPEGCDECKYYKENYLPRVQFIFQIDLAAAVYKDLCCWGGNANLAELCEIPEKGMVGMGIEEIVHADSLETVVSASKRMSLGDLSAPRSYHIFLNRGRRGIYGKLKVCVSVYPLKDPPKTFLLLGEPEDNQAVPNDGHTGKQPDQERR